MTWITVYNKLHSLVDNIEIENCSFPKKTIFSSM